VLEALPGDRKVVVTPGIIELGPLQAEANHSFGRRAGTVADVIIVVARLNREALVSGVREAGRRAEVIVVDTLAQATKSLEGFLRPGDIVLFENDLPDQFEG
jgi:UDP-N-acetylmuramoyl-tripeptide--D-alanyl-D-alanine ligase